MNIPREIRRMGEAGLAISWSDGSEQEIASRVLREKCPCAVCREKRGDESHQMPLTPKKSALRIVEATLEEELKLEQIWGVGQYALGVKWADGHDTGIYTYEYLRSL